MTTTGEGLFGEIVNGRRTPRARLLGAVLAVAAWASLWAWALGGVAAPLGAAVRAAGVPVAPPAAAARPAPDVVSAPPIAVAPCAC